MKLGLLDLSVRTFRPRDGELSDSLKKEFTECFLRFYPGSPPTVMDSYLDQDLIYMAWDRKRRTLLSLSSWSLVTIGDAAVMCCPLMLSAPSVRGTGLSLLYSSLSLLHLKRRHPRHAPYFLATCETHHSYLAIANTAADFWPRHDAETPEKEKELINAVGLRCYGNSWHKSSSTMLANVPMTEKENTIPGELMSNPHVRFFAGRNPHYKRGDCLGVIAPLSLRNTGSMLKRLLLKQLTHLRRR